MITDRTTLVALLLTAAVLTGCSDTTGANNDVQTTPGIPAQKWNPGSPDPQASGPVRTPAPAANALPETAPAVDREDPDCVATAALSIWFTWNTALDSGPDDAAARTAPLLTTAYAREITSTTAQSSPGAQWMSWSANAAVVTPALTVDDEPTPPQTDNLAYRAYRVTQSVDGAPVRESIVAVVLRRGADGWAVSRIQDK